MKILILTLGVAFLCFVSQTAFKATTTTIVRPIDSLPGQKASINTSAKQPEFEYPLLSTTDTAKASFVKRYKKGKSLYAQVCAKCHNITRDIVYYPDFDLAQLLDYEMRFQYPEHNDDLKETQVSVEEMDWIVDFLRYKRKMLPFKKK